MNRKNKKVKVTHNFLALNIPTIVSTVNSNGQTVEKPLGFDIEIYGDESGDKVLIRYHIKNKELYYDNSINKLYQKLLPHPIWWVNDKFYIEAAFNEEFPDKEVKRVSSANIV